MTFVRIRHDDIEGTASCSADAFDLIYEEKGWQIVADDAPPAAPQTPDPGPDPSAAATEPPAAPTPNPVNLLES